MNPDGLDIEYIFKNENTIGFIGNEGIIINPHTRQIELVAAAPVYEYPNLQAEIIYELRNDENNITLDISILSQDALASFRNNITLFNLAMNSAHHIQRAALVSEEDYENITENTETFIPDKIVEEYSETTTKHIVNVLMGKTKKEDANAESLVDDMLSGLFGKPVLTKDDVNPITINPMDGIDNSDIEIPNEISFNPPSNKSNDIINTDNIDYEKKEIEEQLDTSTFEEIIDNIQNQFGNEVVHINKKSKATSSNDPNDPMGQLVDSMLDENKDIFSDALEQMISICTTYSPEKTVMLEPILDNILNNIVNTKFEEYPKDIQSIMLNFCETFHSDENIKFNLLDYKDTMKAENKYLTQLETSEDTKIICVSDMQKYFRVKDSLWSDFHRHHHIYETIYNNSLLNVGLQDSQYPVFFAIAFQLLHLINKNVLKTKHDLYKKEEFMKTPEFKNMTLCKDTKELMEYESDIIKFGSAFIDDFKRIIQNTF